MLRKIKKYKISLRPSFVARSLKKKLTLPSVNDSFEKIVNEEIAKNEPLLSLSSVYSTFSKNEIPEVLKPIWSSAPPKALSLSLIATTIGGSLEKERDSAKNGNDEFKTALLESIGWEAVEQSSNFVFKLLNDESKNEGCECTPLMPVANELLKDSLAILESQKADISIGEDGKLQPYFTQTSFSFWIPASKK